MPLPSPREASEQLLGRAPDQISVLVAWPGHAAHRVEVGGAAFVVKVDADRDVVAREVAGHRRAARAGIPVPELVAAADHCLAVRFVEGTPLSEPASDSAWRAAGSVLSQVHGLAPGALIGDGFGSASATWPEFVEGLLTRELEGCVRELGFDPDQGERIRGAFDDARSLIDQRVPVWCHGDCQPEHVLVDPRDDSVVAIIDWADHGPADPAWDLAVLSLEDPARVGALLDGYGYGARAVDRGEVRTLLSLFGVLRWLGEARWLAARSHPQAAAALERATRWKPARSG